MKRDTLIIILFTLAFLACNSQPKIYGESPVILDNFDFNLNTSKFFPEKFIDENYEYYYNIPVANKLNIDYNLHIYKMDTLFIAGDRYSDINFDAEKKAKWLAYNNKNFSSFDTIAMYGEFVFNTLDVLSTLDHKAIMVNAYLDDIEDEPSKEFIELLDSIYGYNVKTKGDFVSAREYYIYTWESKDKVFKYSTTYDNKKAVISTENEDCIALIEEDEEDLEYESHKGYFFVIKKEFADDLIGKINSGNFIYCK